MPNRKLRDLRRIRPTCCYEECEVAELLQVTKATVRRWRREGLPILGESGEPLIAGDQLKAWLSKKRAARRKKCQVHEFFCCRCRTARNARKGTVEIVSRNAKTLSIRARCGTCDARMNKAGSAAKRIELERYFGIETAGQRNLVGSDNPAVIQHFDKDSEA